jgi:hypothetical protein
MLVEGFAVSRQHCETDESRATINFELMMKQCYSYISDSNIEIISKSAVKIKDLVLQNGTLTWGKMNAAKIPTSDTSIDRIKLKTLVRLGYTRSYQNMLSCITVREESCSSEACGC